MDPRHYMRKFRCVNCGKDTEVESSYVFDYDRSRRQQRVSAWCPECINQIIRETLERTSEQKRMQYQVFREELERLLHAEPKPREMAWEHHSIRYQRLVYEREQLLKPKQFPVKISSLRRNIDLDDAIDSSL